jgi:hypothetical protein
MLYVLRTMDRNAWSCRATCQQYCSWSKVFSFALGISITFGIMRSVALVGVPGAGWVCSPLRYRIHLLWESARCGQ